jgi:hypothetical protein
VAGDADVVADVQRGAAGDREVQIADAGDLIDVLITALSLCALPSAMIASMFSSSCGSHAHGSSTANAPSLQSPPIVVNVETTEVKGCVLRSRPMLA